MFKKQYQALIKSHTTIGLKPSYNQEKVGKIVEELLGLEKPILDMDAFKESFKEIYPESTSKPLNNSEIVKDSKIRFSAPTELKKGDLFIGYSINGKRRPFVVANVIDKDTCAAIPFTTTKDLYALVPCTSRFFDRPTNLTNQVHLVKTEFVQDNFIGVFDNNRALNKALSILQPQFPTLLKRKFNKSLTK